MAGAVNRERLSIPGMAKLPPAREKSVEALGTHSGGMALVLRVYFKKGATMMMDFHANETAVDFEYCAECNATEQGFTPQAGNPEILVCNICGREATRVAAEETHEAG